LSFVFLGVARRLELSPCKHFNARHRCSACGVGEMWKRGVYKRGGHRRLPPRVEFYRLYSSRAWPCLSIRTLTRCSLCVWRMMNPQTCVMVTPACKTPGLTVWPVSEVTYGCSAIIVSTISASTLLCTMCRCWEGSVHILLPSTKTAHNEAQFSAEVAYNLPDVVYIWKGFWGGIWRIEDAQSQPFHSMLHADDHGLFNDAWRKISTASKRWWRVRCESSENVSYVIV